MNINNINSTNFTGYKNVIANKVVRPNGEKITFMSMQLDNVGKADLDIWKNLQNNLMKKDFTTDVITFNVIEYDDMNIAGFSHELLDIDEVKKSSKEESLFLKAFGLIASLTDRIANDTKLITDDNYHPMGYETRYNLSDVLFSDKQKSSELDNAVWGAYYNETEPQEHAKNINNIISKKMIKYFS